MSKARKELSDLTGMVKSKVSKLPREDMEKLLIGSFYLLCSDGVSAVVQLAKMKTFLELGVFDSDSELCDYLRSALDFIQDCGKMVQDNQKSRN